MKNDKQVTRRSILKSAPVIAAPLIPGVTAAPAEPFSIDDCPAMVRAEYHAEELRKAMHEQCGGKWFCTIDEQYGFVIINERR